MYPSLNPTASRELASGHSGGNNHYLPEVILLTTETVPEDFPDKPELDHGFDGGKSLPGFGSTPFLIFIPSREENELKMQNKPDRQKQWYISQRNVSQP